MGREEERKPPQWAGELWPSRPDLGLIQREDLERRRRLGKLEFFSWFSFKKLKSLPIDLEFQRLEMPLYKYVCKTCQLIKLLAKSS